MFRWLAGAIALGLMSPLALAAEPVEVNIG
jgi:hypothetical protein